MVSARSQKGRRAEQRVEWYYRLRGWRLCARNWRSGRSELDLVLSRWKTLVVVEVRMRASGQGLQSVDTAKLARTLEGARAMVHQHQLHRYRLRIDVAAVDADGRVTVSRDVMAGQRGD